MANDLTVDLVGTGIEEDRVELVLQLVRRIILDGFVDAHAHVTCGGVDEQAVGIAPPGSGFLVGVLDFEANEGPGAGNGAGGKMVHTSTSWFKSGPVHSFGIIACQVLGNK